MWYATDICRCCGSCISEGKRSEVCPRVLSSEQVMFSPQGPGPARNIVAYTGGDLGCQIEFYAQLTQKIKEKTQLFVLYETNGYALTPKNLDILKTSGVDSFWLDIKAYDDKVHKNLCGVTNKHILELPSKILSRGFTLEILSLYIPNWVEHDQLRKIAKLVADVDTSIPFTLLAFFPSYKLKDVQRPSLIEFLQAYMIIKEEGLKNVKIGNPHVVVNTHQDWLLIEAIVGKEGIG
jgi:pyruvate-formate lyase-activating enzyme